MLKVVFIFGSIKCMAPYNSSNTQKYRNPTISHFILSIFRSLFQSEPALHRKFGDNRVHNSGVPLDKWNNAYLVLENMKIAYCNGQNRNKSLVLSKTETELLNTVYIFGSLKNMGFNTGWKREKL